MDKEDTHRFSPEEQKEKRKIALRMRMNRHKYLPGLERRWACIPARSSTGDSERYQAEGLKSAVEGGGGRQARQRGR